MNYYLFRDGIEIAIGSRFKLKHMFDTLEVNESDLVRRADSKEWSTVGQKLGLIYNFAGGRKWQFPLPTPPPISWWVTLVLGALTFGYATYVIGAMQAVWSRRIERRWAPVFFAFISVLTPPVHLYWIVHSLSEVGHNFREGAMDLILGLVVAEIVAAGFTAIGSLSVRRTLVRKLEESGFHMNWFFTLIFGPIYVAWVLDELRHSYR